MALLLLLNLADGSGAATDPAVPVTVSPLGALLTSPEYSAPASVVARNTAALSAEVNARIQAIPVLVGDQVEPGALIVQLDCRQYQSQLVATVAGLADLRARHRLAANQLQRARDLKKQRNVSEEVVDQRSTDLASLSAQIRAREAELDQAGLQVERCAIQAPFPSVVVRRLASVGEWATSGTPLIELVELDHSEVSAALREAQFEALQGSESIGFEYLGRRYGLELRAALPTIDGPTRTRELRLRFRAEPAAIGSGGRLVWRGPPALLPAAYLVRRNDRLGVFILEDGQARFRPLPEALEGQPANIDLSPDTELIIEGRERLNDGDRVTPVAPVEPGRPGD